MDSKLKTNNSNSAHNKDAEEELMEEISSLIRSRRQELGISQDQLENIAFGINSKSKWTYRIENGHRKGMTIKTLSKVFKVLKIEIKFNLLEV